MKKNYAIDSISGRLLGESEPDYQALVERVLTENVRLTVSAIQRHFLISYKDALQVLGLVKKHKDIK